MTLFLQGATADLRLKKSKVREHTWELVRKQGERLAEAVIAVASGSKAILDISLVKLKLKVFPLAFDALVTYGAEVFTQIGFQVLDDSLAKHTLSASVSDGYVEYLPTAQA
jgi:hypothetical protein